MNTIKVFINVSEKIIANPQGGSDPAFAGGPIFVNAPTGVREWLLGHLAKDSGGKATRNITWSIPTDALQPVVIKNGENAGKNAWRVVITADGDEGSIPLTNFVDDIVITDRGVVDQKVANILASRPAVAPKLVVGEPF